jgi:N-methylhydantoinase A/oxoprolinase/acetone carboxylase beta subunit
MRYAGQGYELRVALEGIGTLDDAALIKARELFDLRHAQIHGHAAREKEVEVVSYRLRATVSVPKFEPRPQAAADAPAAADAALKGKRMVWFDGLKGAEVPVYERDKIAVGASFAGPAIVEQMDATTVIPAGWGAHVDEYGNLILEAEG